MLPTAIVLLSISAFLWLLLIRDAQTAMAWSNSFSLLSPSATEFAYWAVLVFAGMGALFATIRAVRIQRRRGAAIAVAALSMLLPIADYALVAYVASHTEPEILQQR